jgi:putative transposase
LTTHVFKLAFPSSHGSWFAGRAIHRELAFNALLMAVRRRRPRGTMIHSDQGTPF